MLRKKSKTGVQSKWVGIFMTMPAIVVMVLTVVYPICWSFILSFSDSSAVFSGHFILIGFENFSIVLRSSSFRSAY